MPVLARPLTLFAALFVALTAGLLATIVFIPRAGAVGQDVPEGREAPAAWVVGGAEAGMVAQAPAQGTRNADDIPGWVWATVGGVSGLAIAAGVGYRIWLARRRPPAP